MGNVGTGRGGKTEGTAENKRPVYSKNQLAEVFGVSFSTVAGWCNQSTPRGEGPHGSLYDSRDVFRAAAQQIKARYEVGDREKQLVRKCSAEADLKKLQLAEKRGELVPVEAVLKVLQNIYSDLKARIMPIGSKFAPKVQGLKKLAETEAELNACRDELLEEIRRIQPSRFMAGVGDFGTRDWGNPSADEAPNQDDGEPVGGSKKNVKPGKRGRPRKVEH